MMRRKREWSNSPAEAVLSHFELRAGCYDNAAPWVQDTNILDAIANETRPRLHMRVLDLAAGTGAVARHLLHVQPDLDITALDISEAMLSRLTHPAISKLVSDAHSIDLPSKNFDVIVCRQGFHYFEEPSAVLGECRRLLVAGGSLIIAQITPFGAEDFEHWKKIILAKQPLRRQCWTLDTLDAALVAARFRIRNRLQLRATESLRSWLDRYEHTEVQRRIVEQLHREAPAFYKELHNFSHQDGDLLFDNCWSILAATAGAEDD